MLGQAVQRITDVRFTIYKERGGTKEMFRPVTRFKQALSDEECLEILKNEKRGVLSVLGDDGYPYGMPINYWYSEKSVLWRIMRRRSGSAES